MDLVLTCPLPHPFSLLAIAPHSLWEISPPQMSAHVVASLPNHVTQISGQSTYSILPIPGHSDWLRDGRVTQLATYWNYQSAQNLCRGEALARPASFCNLRPPGDVGPKPAARHPSRTWGTICTSDHTFHMGERHFAVV